MKIVQATPEQEQAVKSIIVEQMAEMLAAEGIDLDDDNAVIAALAGFGSASIAELWETARAMARGLDGRERSPRAN